MVNPLVFPSLRRGPSGPFADPGGDTGGILPLTRDFFVDSGRTTSLEDGSIAQPFKTIQAGIDAVNALPGDSPGSVLIADGDYGTEDLTITANTNLIALGRTIVVNTITINTATCYFEGINGVTLSGAAGAFFFSRCEFGTVNLDQGTLIANLSNIDAVQQATTQTNIVELSLCELGAVQVSDLLLNQTKVAGIIDIAATANIDLYSLNTMRDNNPGAHTINALNITDAPTTVGAFVVPALAGTFADVTVVTPGWKVGDIPLVSVLNSPARLANVGVVGAWAGANSVTVRFFGTTAGGTQSLQITKILTSG